MSAAMALRSSYKDAFEKKNNGVRLGFMSFFVTACIAGLKEFPAVNAEIDGDEIVYKNYVHMGNRRRRSEWARGACAARCGQDELRADRRRHREFRQARAGTGS